MQLKYQPEIVNLSWHIVLLFLCSLHFWPKTPTEEDTLAGSGALGPGPVGPFGSNHPAFRDSLSPPLTTEFNVESFQNHREQLLQMQRQQQEQLLKQETDIDTSFSLDHSFASQPTSRFTLDSASAQFAASAVCNSANDLARTTSAPVGLSSASVTMVTGTNSAAALIASATTTTVYSTSSNPGAMSSSVSTLLTNGPVVDCKCFCFCVVHIEIVRGSGVYSCNYGIAQSLCVVYLRELAWLSTNEGPLKHEESHNYL